MWFASFTLTVNTINPSIPKTIAPIVLNKRCIAAALFAVLELPTLEIIAVTHEPIFCPRVIYMAAAVFTTPLNASVCKIPTDADELCIRAVTTIPTMIPSIGLPPSTLNASENIGALVKGFIFPKTAFQVPELFHL